MPWQKTILNPYALYVSRPPPQGPALSQLKGLAECICEGHTELFFIMLRDKFDEARTAPEFKYVVLHKVGIITIDDMFRRGAFPTDFVEKLRQYAILKPKRGFNG